MFVIAYIQSFTSQIFGVVSPLGENLDFFSPLGFDVQTNSDHKPPKIKLCSVRALKCYLNEKNLIHSRVMATISKFGPHIFETYFRMKSNGCNKNLTQNYQLLNYVEVMKCNTFHLINHFTVDGMRMGMIFRLFLKRRKNINSQNVNKSYIILKHKIAKSKYFRDI